MKTTKTLRRSGTHRSSARRDRSPERVKTPPRNDLVWILLWVLFLAGLMLSIGIFYAVMHPNGSV